MSSGDENTFEQTKGKQWLIFAMREAGKVKRCHTVPCFQNPTVNEHAGNMTDLYLALHPKPTVNMLRAIRMHDFPERWSGDIPAPAKIVLGDHLKEMEARIMEATGLGYSLTEEEGRWLHALDKLELLMWAMDQRAMGNENVAPMQLDLLLWFQKNGAEGNIPDEFEPILNGFGWVRLSDYVPY